MTTALLHIWERVCAMGAAHGVNPALFAALYLTHHPLFWGTMAWLTARVRRRQPVGGVAALGAFFWLMPYLYVLGWGRSLPLWLYGCVALALIVGGGHALREARRRMASRNSG